MDANRCAIAAPSACSPLAGLTITSKSVIWPSTLNCMISTPFTLSVPTWALNSRTTALSPTNCRYSNTFLVTEALLQVNYELVGILIQMIFDDFSPAET